MDRRKLSFSNIIEEKPFHAISDDTFFAVVGRLERVCTLSNAFKTKLKNQLYEATYHKGSHILNAGALQRCAWFIVDGILQELNIDKETYLARTTWFWFEGAFVYASPGFFDQEPSRITINVVRETKVVFITYEGWKHLRDTFAEAEKLIEKLRSYYELERKVHLNDLNLLGTERRYSKYEAQINRLARHIQLKHIAEFVGMSTDTLGKLRRRAIKSKKPSGRPII